MRRGRKKRSYQFEITPCILYTYPLRHLFVVTAHFRPSQQFGQSVQIHRGRRIESGYQFYVMQNDAVALKFLRRLATQEVRQTDLGHHRLRAAGDNAHSLVGHQHPKILRAAAQTLVGDEEFGIVAVVNAVQKFLALGLLTIVRRQQSGRTADDTRWSVAFWDCTVSAVQEKIRSNVGRYSRSLGKLR